MLLILLQLLLFRRNQHPPHRRLDAEHAENRPRLYRRSAFLPVVAVDQYATIFRGCA